MIRWLDKTEMKLVYVVKYGVLALSLFHLGAAVYRYIRTNNFDNVALLATLSSLMYFIFVFKLNKLLKLSKKKHGSISMFQVKIMLMYLCRIALAPLLIFSIRNGDVFSSVIIAILFFITFAGDFVFRYIDMKQNPVPISRQGSQTDGQHETE